MPATRTLGQAAFITPATPPWPPREEITLAATRPPTVMAARRITPATALAPVMAHASGGYHSYSTGYGGGYAAGGYHYGSYGGYGGYGAGVYRGY